MDFICMLMVAWHKTSRDMESDLSIKVTVVERRVRAGSHYHARHLQTILSDWLTWMLARTARLCMAEADGATGPLGADRSGVVTTSTRPSYVLSKERFH